MRGRVLALTFLMSGLAVSCSVIDDGKVDRIDPPFGLSDTLAPTTTLAPTSAKAPASREKMPG